MRIAYLVHFYPPASSGGAGYYTASLAEAFAEVGAEVGVLCVERWGDGSSYYNGYSDEVRNGVFVRRLNINWRKAPRPFDWLYDSPVLGEHARAFLTSFQPDVVHASSCYTLSARPIMIARDLNLPIVMHLHDYWTICPRLTLLHKDGSVCSGPEGTWKCQRCLLEGAKSWKIANAIGLDIDPQPIFETLAQQDWATRLPSLRGMLGDLGKRQEFVRACMQAADVLVAPTQFAANLLQQHAPPSTSIRVMPYGSQLNWLQGMCRTCSSRLRVGFLGNVIPIKGVHVLIEAFKTLQQAGLPVDLTICGDIDADTAYYRSLRLMCPESVIWRGRYTRNDLPEILGELDVVVVPSICYETQGIVIQEAFAAGLPVLVSAGTSLTESVQDEKNGLYFQMGSAAHLEAQLRRLIDEPKLLTYLQSNIPPLRTLEQDVDEYNSIYTILIQRQKFASHSRTN